MDLIGVREELLEEPRVGPILGQTVRRRGAVTGAPAPVYFAGEASDGGEDKDKEEEAAEYARRVQEPQLAHERLAERRRAANLRRPGRRRSSRTLELAKGKHRARRYYYETAEGTRQRLAHQRKMDRTPARLLGYTEETLTTGGVEPVPEATLAQDDEPSSSAPPPPGVPIKQYSELGPLERLVFDFTLWGIMDRNIPATHRMRQT